MINKDQIVIGKLVRGKEVIQVGFDTQTDL